jgi:two-component system, OmpR family, response regulator
VSLTRVNLTEDSTRVLVVDDEPNITELVSLGLRYEGFDVSNAHDGRGAHRAIREFKPELAILDVTMPDIDGFEVVRRMRADGIWTPVIFLTARDVTEDKIAPRSGGSAWRSTGCSSGSRTRLLAGIARRRSCDGSSPARRMSCARR